MRGVIYWKETPLPFEVGETIAATLARNGIRVPENPHVANWRIFCGIGQCQQCVVLIDGKRPAEACLTLAQEGMRIEPVLSEEKNGCHD